MVAVYDSNNRKYSYACERNQDLILKILEIYFPKDCCVLEIASGTGQHAYYFTSKQRGWRWQATDVDSESIESISAYQKESKRGNFLAPRKLSTVDKTWDLGRFEAALCCNMIHISPWESCLGLFLQLSKHLKQGSYFALYGPFIQKGLQTALSNINFDSSLKQTNPLWGIRNLEEVTKAATRHSFKLFKVHEMAANNLLVVFEKS
jgi:hypothetical protein